MSFELACKNGRVQICQCHIRRKTVVYIFQYSFRNTKHTTNASASSHCLWMMDVILRLQSSQQIPDCIWEGGLYPIPCCSLICPWVTHSPTRLPGHRCLLFPCRLTSLPAIWATSLGKCLSFRLQEKQMDTWLAQIKELQRGRAPVWTVKIYPEHNCNPPPPCPHLPLSSFTVHTCYEESRLHSLQRRKFLSLV